MPIYCLFIFNIFDYICTHTICIWYIQFVYIIYMSDSDQNYKKKEEVRTRTRTEHTRISTGKTREQNNFTHNKFIRNFFWSNEKNRRNHLLLNSRLLLLPFFLLQLNAGGVFRFVVAPFFVFALDANPVFFFWLY